MTALVGGQFWWMEDDVAKEELLRSILGVEVAWGDGELNPICEQIYCEREGLA